MALEELNQVLPALIEAEEALNTLVRHMLFLILIELI
jgi:hypothetical protein